MGDSHYWTSLWVLVLFIVLSVVCFSLGGSLLAFLSERIGAFEIGKSPVWLKLKTPLIVLGVIGLVAAVIAFIRYNDRREMKIARDYAQAQGWGFSRDDTDGLTAKVAEILSGYYLNLYYIRTVETGWRSVTLFDC